MSSQGVPARPKVASLTWMKASPLKTEIVAAYFRNPEYCRMHLMPLSVPTVVLDYGIATCSGKAGAVFQCRHSARVYSRRDCFRRHQQFSRGLSDREVRGAPGHRSMDGATMVGKWSGFGKNSKNARRYLTRDREKEWTGVEVQTPVHFVASDKELSQF